MWYQVLWWDGFKLDDAREAEIEALLDATEDTLPRPSAEGLGTLVDYPEVFVNTKNSWWLLVLTSVMV